MLCAASVAEAIGDRSVVEYCALRAHLSEYSSVRIVPSSSLTGFAAELLKAGCRAAAKFDRRIIQVRPAVKL